jgi:hypothetical protein
MLGLAVITVQAKQSLNHGRQYTAVTQPVVAGCRWASARVNSPAGIGFPGSSSRPVWMVLTVRFAP